MKLNSKDKLFGCPALVLRNALRGMPGEGSGVACPLDWKKHLPNFSRAQQLEVEAHLLEGGFIFRPYSSRSSHPDDNRFFALTSAGLRLARASGRTYKRGTAEVALSKLLKRAVEINQGDYAYSIETLIVFGSFARPEVDLLGDLDIAYEIRRLYEGSTEGAEGFEGYMAWARKYRDRSPRSISYLSWLFWPETEVLRRLKGRSPVISLTPLSGHEEMLAGAPYQVVLGSWSPPEVPNVRSAELSEQGLP